MADYQYINETGVVVPDTGDILDGVQNEYRNAFGDDLIVTPDTPQGVLITAEALSRDAVVRNNAALANQINPNLAGGVFLDAICALTALERTKATRSLVTATLTGVQGSIIPLGVRARTSTGDLFESLAQVVIGMSGTVSAPFRSVEFGPIGAIPNALNQIVDPVLGWETITNPLEAVLGRNEQTDQSLRALRRLTLAKQGIALTEAQISDLYTVEGVKSLTFRENVTSSPATIDGVLMAAHSIYACVDGGSDLDVATALLNNKSAGAGWNGSESVVVVEPTSGQSYTVLFDRPDPIPFIVRATVKVNSALIDPVSAVKTAIMNYANGLMEGERGLVVGASVSPFELAGAVNRETPGIYVQLLEVSDDGGANWQTTEIPIAIFEIATITESGIAVTVV